MTSPSIMYKIVYENDHGHYGSIDKGELTQAMILYLAEGGEGCLGGQMIRGRYIKQICPDWHATMGYSADMSLNHGRWCEIGSTRVVQAREELNHARKSARRMLRRYKLNTH